MQTQVPDQYFSSTYQELASQLTSRVKEVAWLSEAVQIHESNLGQTSQPGIREMLDRVSDEGTTIIFPGEVLAALGAKLASLPKGDLTI